MKFYMTMRNKEDHLDVLLEWQLFRSVLMPVVSLTWVLMEISLLGGIRKMGNVVFWRD